MRRFCRTARQPTTLGQLGRSEEKLAAYDQVIGRYGDDPAPALREITERARGALAEMPDDAE